MSVAKNTIVVAELLKQIENLNDDFLTVIPSADDKVNNEVINFNEIGADPTVLIDNAVYPIVSAQRDDEARPVALKKLDTTNTDITDDELFALGYDKKSSVMVRHVASLKREQLKLSAYSLAPTSNSSNTPVIKTTGGVVGLRKTLTPADLVALKAQADLLQIPLDARFLCLSSKHANDLLLVDQSFRDRYYNTATGKVITNILGFNIYETIYAPKYNGTNDTKKAYGAAGAGTDVDSSFFYTNINTIKAKGSTKMYSRLAENHPENRKTTVGFRQYYLTAPITAKAIGSIIDTYTGS